MKFLIVVLAMFAMVAAFPEERERRSLGVPLATAVVGPAAVPAAVIGPHGGAVVSAVSPAVVAASVPLVAGLAHGAVIG